jgi:hypothetical protein
MSVAPPLSILPSYSHAFWVRLDPQGWSHAAVLRPQASPARKSVASPHVACAIASCPVSLRLGVFLSWARQQPEPAAHHPSLPLQPWLAKLGGLAGQWTVRAATPGRGEPSPGADVGGVSPVPVRMRAEVSPVPVPMWTAVRQGK